jgi:queuine tRNA-ribosyltransferase
VTFKSHIDGSTHRFTPEKSIAIQENLGADIIMAFDECSDPNDKAYSAIAMDRTHRWAERSLKAQTRPDQALFGIIQGGVQADLRAESAKFIASLDTPGIAIGGLSVGETKQEMHDTLDVVHSPAARTQTALPDGSRHPEDLINGVARGTIF